MKRILVATTLMGAALVVAAGAAWAATVECEVGVRCVGTNQSDKLVGTDKPDFMEAKQDDDRLLGFRGADIMFGDDPSLINGPGTLTDGDDELFGNDGKDFLVGFGGSDLLRGGGRADYIQAEDFEGETLNPGEDTVITGGGKDFIRARDDFRDTIDCGDNVDTVFFNEGLDVVADNCEILNPPPTATTTEAQELASPSRR